MKNRFILLPFFILVIVSCLFVNVPKANSLLITMCADICGGGGGGGGGSTGVKDFYYNGSCDNHNILSGNLNDPEGVVVKSYGYTAGSDPARITNSNMNNNYWLSVNNTNLKIASGYNFYDGIVGVNMPFSPTGGISWSGVNANASFFDPIGLSTNSPAAFNNKNGSINCVQTYGGYSWNQSYYAHDFVFEPNFGWVLFCGYSEGLAVNFNFSIYNNSPPYGYNTGGYWVLTSDPPATFASKGPSAYPSNSFTFNYNTLSSNGQKFQNGFSNIINAYYVEPKYNLTTSASNDYPSNKYVNVNDNKTVNFNVTSGVKDKANISNSFNYTSNTTLLINKYNGSSLAGPLSSNVATIQSISTDSSSSKTLYSSGSIPILIKSSYTIYGFTINLSDGDKVCVQIQSTPNSNAPYQAPVSTSISCVIVSIPVSNPTITCSEMYMDGTNESIFYSINNNTTTPITIGANGWSMVETISGGPYNQNAPNSTWPFGAANSINYPPTINPGNSGNGSYSWRMGQIPYYALLGTYFVRLTLNGPNNFQATANCLAHVVARPYFKVYGGSIMTGSGISDSSGSCSTTNNKNSNIVGFNYPGFSGVVNGSSTDQAIFASGNIFGVGSQNTPGSSQLTFTNSNIPSQTIANLLGGSFNDGIQCMPDYFSNVVQAITSSTTNVTFLNDPTIDQNVVRIAPQIVDFNGVQLISQINEILTKGYSTIVGNQNVLIGDSKYGDVHISNNLIMPSTISTDGKLPYLYIISKGGNVYIDNNVTEVDAVIIAEPDSNGNGGNIYTCTNTKTSASDFNVGGCNLPLTIKGALMASKINLLRSTQTYYKGTLNNFTGGGVSYENGSAENAISSTSGCEPPATWSGGFKYPLNTQDPAGTQDPGTFNGGEQICYSPLLWMTDPYTSVSKSSLDYMQNLPATL